MVTPIDRHHLIELLDAGAQLLEVLPAHEYDEEHLSGAVNIPLKELDEAAVAGLDKSRATVVYCWDALCDMSPRAAVRLEHLGFNDVYDYVTSKVDWLAAGLPTEGTGAAASRAGTAADRTVPTCGLHDNVGDVAARVRAAGWDQCIVIDDNRLVHGRLRQRQLDNDPTSPVHAVMELGPSTVRAHETLEPLLERLRDRRSTSGALVTTAEGHLIGIIRP